jgi:hypothetical protein
MNNKYESFAHIVLDHFLRNTATASPVTVYVALFNTTPTKTTPGTEVSGTAYARVPVTFGAPSGGVVTTSSPVSFPTAGAGGWGTVNGCGIFDQASGGQLYYFGDLTASKTVDAGDTVTFATGALSVTET